MKRVAVAQIERPAKKSKQGGQGAQRQVIVQAGGGHVRQGFAAVARSPGAAVIGEMKYFDCALQNTALVAAATDWTGSMQDPNTTIDLGSAAVANPLCLFVPTVGAALNQRIGRKVKVLKVKVQGRISCANQAAAAAGDAVTAIRLVLCLDQQTNAAQMTGQQLFNPAPTATGALVAFQNPNNFGRFRVLKEKRFMLQNPNMTGSPTAGDVVQSGIGVNFKFNVNFKVPVEVHFNATNGGTVADVVDNSFHMLCSCDSTALAPFIAYYSRVCYKE